MLECGERKDQVSGTEKHKTVKYFRNSGRQEKMDNSV